MKDVFLIIVVILMWSMTDQLIEQCVNVLMKILNGQLTTPTN